MVEADELLGAGGETGVLMEEECFAGGAVCESDGTGLAVALAGGGLTGDV